MTTENSIQTAKSIAQAVNRSTRQVERILAKLNMKARDEGALDAVRQFVEQAEARAGQSKEIDQESGESYFKLNQREDYRRKKRENDLQEAILKKQWIEVSACYEAIKAISAQIEQIPAKAKAEFGLTQDQMVRLQKLYDAAREDSATIIECSLTSNSEKQLQASSVPLPG